MSGPRRISVRRSRGRIILIAVLFASGLLIIFGTLTPAHAQTTTEIDLSDAATVCPQLGGTWTAGNSQCYLSPTGGLAASPVYTVQNGNTLRIDAGVIVSWGRGTLYNNGTIVNRGSLVPAEGALMNSGSIMDLGVFNITITSIFTNTGSVQISAPGVFTIVSGTLENYGTIIVFSQFNDLHGAVYNGVNGIIADDGTLSNYAGGTLFQNYGKITTIISSSLLNFGFITNHGMITNDGTLTDPSNDQYIGHFTNVKTGTVLNSGTFNNSQGVVIMNSGNITNGRGGTMTLAHTATINSNGTIDNQGKLVLNGTLNTGTDEPTAAGSILNTGTMNVYGGTINQEGNATFTNLKSGTLELETPTENQLSALDLENTHDYGMTNPGTIKVDSGAMLVIQKDAFLASAGAITVAKGGSFSMENVYFDNAFTTSGMVTNAGAFTASGTINSGSFSNSGVLTVAAGDTEFSNVGALTNLNSGTILIYGELENSGTGPEGYTLNGPAIIVNYGSVNNTVNGVIANLGSMNNYGALNNVGGMITAGTFANTKTVNNSGTLVIYSASSFTNAGKIFNSGKIYSHGSRLGSVTNLKGGSIVNGGGSLYNYGDFVNSGTITTDSDGSISNYGTMTSNGTISNGGSFTDYCQGSVTSVSGNPPTTSPCATPTITTASGQTFDVTNPTVNGTSDANAVIKLTEATMTVGQTTADSTGNWTITVNPRPPGTYTLAAEAYGTGGNSGSVSIEVIISPGATATATATTSSSSASSTISVTPTTTSSSASTVSTKSTTVTTTPPTTTSTSSSSSNASSTSLSTSYLLLVGVTAGVILLLGLFNLRRGKKLVSPRRSPFPQN